MRTAQSSKGSARKTVKLSERSGIPAMCGVNKQGHTKPMKVGLGVHRNQFNSRIASPVCSPLATTGIDPVKARA